MSNSSAASSRVILKGTKTWDTWLLYIEEVAIEHNVWELCDPSQEKPTLLKAPEEVPTIEEAKEKYKDDWFQMRQSLNLDWVKKDNAYLLQKKRLSKVSWTIRKSVDASYRPLIADFKTPWELMNDLYKRFAPESDPTYKTRLRQQWWNLDRGLDRNTDIDKWLINWETLQLLCKKAKMPEADDAKNQFLEAISVMSPAFYGIWVLRLRDKDDIPFADILNRYKAHWKITYGKPAGQQRRI